MVPPTHTYELTCRDACGFLFARTIKKEEGKEKSRCLGEKLKCDIFSCDTLLTTNKPNSNTENSYVCAPVLFVFVFVFWFFLLVFCCCYPAG